MTERINTEGVVEAGELTTRAWREVITEPDFANARVAGADAAYREALKWVQERIDTAEIYADTRALQEMVTWLGDKIRAVHSTATNGIPHA